MFESIAMRKRKAPTGPRNILSVEIVPLAGASLDAITARHSWARKDVIARVLHWLAAQDDEVRAVVLGLVPPSLIKQAQEIAIRRLNGEVVGSPVRPDVTGLPVEPPSAAQGPDVPPPDEPPPPANGKRGGKSR